MPLDVTASVAVANMVTGRSQFRRFSQHFECRRQQVDVPLGLFKSPLFARVYPNTFQVALGLFKSPLFARVYPNTFQVALGGGGEPVLSHVRGGVCA